MCKHEWQYGWDKEGKCSRMCVLCPVIERVPQLDKPIQCHEHFNEVRK